MVWELGLCKYTPRWDPLGHQNMLLLKIVQNSEQGSGHASRSVWTKHNKDWWGTRTRIPKVGLSYCKFHISIFPQSCWFIAVTDVTQLSQCKLVLFCFFLTLRRISAATMTNDGSWWQTYCCWCDAKNKIKVVPTAEFNCQIRNLLNHSIANTSASSGIQQQW